MWKRAAGVGLGVLWVATSVAVWRSGSRVEVSAELAQAEAAVWDIAQPGSYAFLDDGSVLQLSVDQPVDSGTGTQLGATITLDQNEAGSQAVVFAIDVSGSTIWVDPPCPAPPCYEDQPPIFGARTDGCAGAFNGDAYDNTVMDCEDAAALALVEEMARFGLVKDVGIV